MWKVLFAVTKCNAHGCKVSNSTLMFVIVALAYSMHPIKHPCSLLPQIILLHLETFKSLLCFALLQLLSTFYNLLLSLPWLKISCIVFVNLFEIIIMAGEPKHTTSKGTNGIAHPMVHQLLHY